MTSTCNCVPITCDDGVIADHDGHCPRWYDNLHTAADIARARLSLFDLIAGPRGPIDPDCGQPQRGCMAQGITVRAVELGLEQP
jgi:hypothetical protein